MAFETGLPNHPTPIKNLGQESGRIVKEDDFVVNFADWLADVTSPGSGLTINVDTGGVSNPTNVSEINNENSRILFRSDFFAGLDTLNKFHLVYDNSIVLPGIVNAGSGAGGFGQFGPALTLLGYVPVILSFDGAADTNQWVCQSQNVIKIGENETAYLFYSGLFRDSAQTGPIEVSIEAQRTNFFKINYNQSSWNIDTLDGSESASNPSGITLDVNSVMNFVMKITYNNIGDIKFGFFIDNKVVYVHEIIESNNVAEQRASNNQPMRVEGGIEGGSGVIPEVVTKIGYFGNISGYYLKIKQVQAGGPSETTQNIYGLSGFAVGSNQNDYYRTFANGNGVSLVTVGAARIPIVSIRPKAFFPPKLPPDPGTIDNLSIMSLKEIKVSGTGNSEDFGVLVDVVFNQGVTLLTGSAFSTNDVNSGVEIDTSATAISAGGTQIYRKTIYVNQGSLDLTIKASDLLGNFMNHYSHTTILAPNIIPVKITPEISIVATSVTGDFVNISAEFVWVERP